MRKSLPILVVLLFLLMAGGAGANRATQAAPVAPGERDLPALPADRTPVSPAQGEQIARDHLVANAASLGLTAGDVAALRPGKNITLSSGARVVHFIQTVNGITVYNAALNVTILPNRQVIYVGNRGVANLASSVNSATPSRTARQAIDDAAAALGLAYTSATVREQKATGGAERETTFSGGDLSLEPISTRLIYQPMEDGSVKLAWNVDIYQRDAQHWWDVRVDASTGALLSRADYVVSENFDQQLADSIALRTTRGEDVSGYAPVPYAPRTGINAAPNAPDSYVIYDIPVESPNHTTPLPPADGRTTVVNPANGASPFGWHDTNGAAGAEFTTTQGNNVHAYTDVDANNLPDAGSSPNGGATLDFNFPINLTQPPSAYRPAAVVNLFAWNNFMHDVSHLYGFNEANFNFQQNNYGNGGLGNDYVFAEAQDGSGTNNANFLTPPDGTNPRMQMYIGTNPTPDQDGDLDNGVIAHEYGHGISIRQTGAVVTCLQNQEQMGEGWSDWQSLLFTMEPGDTANDARGIGTYLFGQPANGPGIRPAPYSRDFGVNNFDYNDRTAVSIPHGLGFIWASMIWDMNWNLIDVYGFNPDIYAVGANDGNIIAYQLVNDGLNIQPCSPGFEDGRDAILAADVARYAGANRCFIWQAFARRGMGFSADQGLSTSVSDGVAAFDLPSDCIGFTPTPTVTPGGPTLTPSNTPSPTVTRTPSNTATATATLPPGQQVVTYCSTFTPLPIIDLATVTGTLSIAPSATILDANLQISTTHTFIGDLIYTLSRPGTSRVVVDRPGRTTAGFGCGGDNILGSYVDDEGLAGTWESSCVAGSPAYPPGSRLIGGATPVTGDPLLMTAFDGGSTAATWSLSVSDNAGGDTGTLDRFCMEFLIQGATPTATATGQATSTATATATRTPTAQATNTATATATRTPTAQATNTATATATVTTGATSTATATPTTGATSTATVTATPGGTGGRYCSTTPIPIPDNSSGSGTIVVPDAFTISDLNIIVTGTHTWVGDVTLTISNGTTSVAFFDRPGVPASTFGCSGDDFPGVFADDEGTDGAFETACQDATPAYTPGGRYTPNSPLSVYDGGSSAGTWTLTAADAAAPDTGTITGWCLDFNAAGGPTPTATATATVPGPVPDINVTPNAFTETHNSPPQTTTDTMNIQNVGSGSLTWTIVEDDTATTPVQDITDKVSPAPRDARLATANAGVVQTRFLQSGAMVPSLFGGINLVLDDGTPENGIGLTNGGELIWFNRFTPAPTDYPFTLNTIQLYTGSDSLCSATDTVDFYVYQDADSNPANGATFVSGLTGQTLGTLDQFNSYAVNINLTGPGDVLILAVNRTCDLAGQFPASIDQTASQMRSWIGFYGGTVPNPPTLPAPQLYDIIDNFGLPGNWMIRGEGSQGGGACSAPTDIPWLTVSPNAGSTAGGGSTPVTLTYNSASLANGTYTGTLCIASNDPDEALVTVPITLNVGPPTAIDLTSFTSPVAGVNLGDLAAAGLLLLAGAVLVLRRK